jgi:hypothetical protein
MEDEEDCSENYCSSGSYKYMHINPDTGSLVGMEEEEDGDDFEDATGVDEDVDKDGEVDEVESDVD